MHLALECTNTANFLLRVLDKRCDNHSFSVWDWLLDNTPLRGGMAEQGPYFHTWYILYPDPLSRGTHSTREEGFGFSGGV
jgi:hypothetical protein